MKVSSISNEQLIKAIEEHLYEELSVTKIAERLHNMRTIEFMDEKKKAVKAKETVDVYMPIARRLGNDKIIAELNDLSIKCI